MNKSFSDKELNENLIKSKKISTENADLESGKLPKKENNTQPKPAPKKLLLTYKRLLRYTYREWGLVVMGNICLCINSLCQIAIPYICGQIINTIGGPSQNANYDLKFAAFEFGILSIVGGLSGFVRGTCYNLLGERIIRKLRNDIFKSLIEKDIEFYDGKKTGDLLSRLSSDTAVVQSSASDNISILIRNLLQTIGSFVILWLLSWELTLALFISIPLVLISVAIFARFYRKLTKDYQSSLADASIIASEAFGNVRIVKSFSKEDKETMQYDEKMTNTYKIGKTRAYAYGIFIGVISTIANGAILSVLWYGGTLVINGTLSIGNLSSFILYTISLAISLLSMNGALTSIYTAMGAAEQIFLLMDYIPKINSSGGITKPHFEGDIELTNVSFYYPTKEEVKVLDNVSFKIKNGEVAALVGASGSGKSSIISLVERFYDVTEGKMLVDGMDIKDLDLRWYHGHIGYVSQEPSLFSGTIEENITYGLEAYTPSDIDKALRIANAYDFVMDQKSFPQGLKTVVGDRGVKLSGGQKQRIAIARAVIKNPRILIFDEATSALDAESEFQVQQAIDSLIKAGDKTVIIIAHRLSTIINSPRILVLQNGKLVEEGNHTELLTKNGVYKALIERQLSGYHI